MSRRANLIPLLQESDVPTPSTAWETRAAAGEPFATVQVQNLEASIQGPPDAWGRPNKLQPVRVSAEIGLRHPFHDSSSGDAVNSDTVHYGLLSKELQRLLQQPCSDVSMMSLIGEFWSGLIGDLPHAGGSGAVHGFLNLKSMQYFRLEVLYPKASLVGRGVSTTLSAAWGENESQTPRAQSATLKIHDLHVPTLIGVNDNERTAKQMVIANVQIDKWMKKNKDIHTGLEKAIATEMENSSFETLEALATTLCQNIKEYLHSQAEPLNASGWRIGIALEKPIAVTMAEAPKVSLSVDTCDI